MGIISWLIVGLIAGWLTGMVMKGSGYGVVGDIVLGIIGALVGGFLASAVFGADVINGINAVTILVAFLGAVLVVAIIRAVGRPARV